MLRQFDGSAIVESRLMHRVNHLVLERRTSAGGDKYCGEKYGHHRSRSSDTHSRILRLISSSPVRNRAGRAGHHDQGNRPRSVRFGVRSTVTCRESRPVAFSFYPCRQALSTLFLWPYRGLCPSYGLRSHLSRRPALRTRRPALRALIIAYPRVGRRRSACPGEAGLVRSGGRSSGRGTGSRCPTRRTSSLFGGAWRV